MTSWKLHADISIPNFIGAAFKKLGMHHYHIQQKTISRGSSTLRSPHWKSRNLTNVWTAFKTNDNRPTANSELVGDPSLRASLSEFSHVSYFIFIGAIFKFCVQHQIAGKLYQNRQNVL